MSINPLSLPDFSKNKDIYSPSFVYAIGIHSGPAVSGIVGKIRRRFCIFGDTVNMASRTETSCPPGRVQVTEETHRLAAPHLLCLADEVVFEDRGEVVVKGAAAPIRMYLARQEAGDGAGRGSSRDIITTVHVPASDLSAAGHVAITDHTSFGSTVLARMSNLHLGYASDAPDSSTIVMVGQGPTSASSEFSMQ